MSERVTLGQFKTQFSWVQFLNLDASDSRWLMVCNEALKRLMDLGLWVGNYQRYQICTTNACLTWPRQFETIEVVDICGTPVTVRNQWFEFLDQGPGLWRGGCGSTNGVCCPTYNYLSRGRGYVMFDDLTENSKLRFYTQFAADAGKVINIRGFDANNQWVLTNGGATEGEDVTLVNGYVDTVTEWGPQVFRQVIKAKTLGHVRVYAVPTATPAITKPMAIWEPTETIPDYLRCTIPMLENSTGCCNGVVADTTCKPTVTVMARLAFIPLETDLDILPLTCTPAIKMAMLAVVKQEKGDTEGARAAMHGTFNPISRQFEDGAIPMLEAELDAFQGAGTVAPIRMNRTLETAGVMNFL